MNVLVVCSVNSGRVNPFILEQVDSLKKTGIEIDIFGIDKRGVLGYLKCLRNLKKILSAKEYDLVHAHFGYSGLLANLQREVPVITTYHGSDIHYSGNRILSWITSRLSSYNILTHKSQINYLRLKKNYSLIPCGVNQEIFRPKDKMACRKKFNFRNDQKLILFSSNFRRSVKNPSLAKKAVNMIPDAELIELEGYSKTEVSDLLNACDLVLITSDYETGPLIAKEALLCNTPIISTDVGDVRDIINGVKNCFIVSKKANEIANKIKFIYEKNNAQTGDKRKDLVEEFNLDKVAKQVLEVYKKV